MKPLLYSTTFLSVLVASTFAHAESFKHVSKDSGNVLEIEQSYSEDGVSQPRVSINGAVLRDFSLKQKLTLVYSDKLDDAEEVTVIHHWDGGNACSGNLTVFSLSKDGFFQSSDLGNCTETYEAAVINDEGFKVLEIKTYQDETKETESGRWHYSDGFVAKR
ncbi:MAG: hypothetical protein AAF423_10405 [Pseudomonadota bacterium]